MNTDSLDRLISAEDALRRAAALATEAKISGMRPLATETGGISLLVEFRRASSVNCSLSVAIESGDRTPVTQRRSHEVVDHVWAQTARVTVTWSSTDRTIATATAALALYREVVDLAALIECELAPKLIGWSEQRAKAEVKARSAR